MEVWPVRVWMQYLIVGSGRGRGGWHHIRDAENMAQRVKERSESRSVTQDPFFPEEDESQGWNQKRHALRRERELDSPRRDVPHAHRPITTPTNQHGAVLSPPSRGRARRPLLLLISGWTLARCWTSGTDAHSPASSSSS